MKTYKVSVLTAEGGDTTSIYIVAASTPEDAQQLGFVLDGGWSREETDASGMLPLAQSYCEAIEINHYDTPLEPLPKKTCLH